MKALAIRQPWAWAILHAGKDVENRDWKEWNPGLKYRGRFLIHASAGMTKAEYEDCLDTLHTISRSHPFPDGLTLPAFGELERGGIVGMANIVDAISETDGAHSVAGIRALNSPWFFGPFGLVIAEAKPLPFVPIKGMLGFFDMPRALMAGLI